MKVYIVEHWFDDGLYSSHSLIKAYTAMEKAQQYVDAAVERSLDVYNEYGIVALEVEEWAAFGVYLT